MDRDELRHHMKIQLDGMSIRQWCRLNKCNVSHVAAFLQGKKGPPGDLLRALNLRVDYVAVSQQAEARAQGLEKVAIDLAASLAAATSLLEKGGKAAKKAAPSDTMFDIMLQDYRNSLSRARDALTAYRSGKTIKDTK